MPINLSSSLLEQTRNKLPISVLILGISCHVLPEKSLSLLKLTSTSLLHVIRDLRLILYHCEFHRRTWLVSFIRRFSLMDPIHLHFRCPISAATGFCRKQWKIMFIALFPETSTRFTVNQMSTGTEENRDKVFFMVMKSEPVKP